MSNPLVYNRVADAARAKGVTVTWKEVEIIDKLLAAQRQQGDDAKRALQTGERIAPSQLGDHGHGNNR